MSKGRLQALIYLLAVLALILLARLIELQLFHHDFYKQKAEDQRRRIINLAAERGDIYDRRGHVLATTLDTFSVAVNPRIFSSPEALSKLLGEPVGALSKKRAFSWVKRKIAVELAAKLRSAKIAGVLLLPDKKRVYPKGRLAAQILGFTGLDNEGLSGVELAWDRYLKGKEGRLITESDPLGYELPQMPEREEAAHPGMNVTLTIDEPVQYLAERELAKILKQFKASAGNIIVMDVENGEILALAGLPDFDPNEYQKSGFHLWKSRALDVYEPGSTFKVITACAGLQEGVIEPDEKLKALDTLEIGGKVIENSHPIDWPGSRISLSFMLEKSINTGAAQVSLKLGPERFYKMIREFGFGEATGLGLYGESRGIVKPPQAWYKPDIAMMSFGQSIAVTPLQLLAAYAAIAHGGVRIKPVLIKKIESPDGTFVRSASAEELNRVLSLRVTEQAKKLMENVVLFGSGKRAQMKYFRVGGKTGTAQKALPGGRGYMKNHFIASFCGFAPLDDPRIAILVLVDDPQGVIWGETVAGPAFKTVMEGTLRYLNVKPDTSPLHPSP
ncbi:stage V sporulation protein D [Candidatus Saganbacteria bacterium]|nr:stage V sporulation protein D [Candidatus Saganbacteria bacterium]